MYFTIIVELLKTFCQSWTPLPQVAGRSKLKNAAASFFSIVGATATREEKRATLTVTFNIYNF